MIWSLQANCLGLQVLGAKGKERKGNVKKGWRSTLGPWSFPGFLLLQHQSFILCTCNKGAGFQEGLLPLSNFSRLSVRHTPPPQGFRVKGFAALVSSSHTSTPDLANCDSGEGQRPLLCFLLVPTGTLQMAFPNHSASLTSGTLLAS